MKPGIEKIELPRKPKYIKLEIKEDFFSVFKKIEKKMGTNKKEELTSATPPFFLFIF